MFFTTAITGLTADILLRAATIAYPEDQPTFALRAEGQFTWAELVQCVIDGKAEGRTDLRT